MSSPPEKKKPKGTRRLARELALVLLFQKDLNGGAPEKIAHNFELNFDPAKDDEGSLELSIDDFHRSWSLARELFFGVCAHLDEIDRGLSEAAANWSIARMAPVDKGLIRLAYYEILYREDIPAKVSLNEALEIAKSYGDGESGAFINGVLDKLLRLAVAKNPELKIS